MEPGTIRGAEEQVLLESGTEQHPRVVRLLRCRETGRYLGERGWVSNPSAAFSFPNTDEAMRVCAEYNLIDVELDVTTPGSHFSFLIR